DGDLVALGAGLEPRRHGPVEGVDVVSYHDHFSALALEADDVALAEPVARDRDPLAVHEHVAVADELAGLVAAGAPTSAVHDIVEPELEHAQQVLAGDARLAGRLPLERGGLILQQAIDSAGPPLPPQRGQGLA